MTGATSDTATARDNLETERREEKVRRFATRMTIVVIVLCNTVVLGGIRASGLNLDRLILAPDVYDPRKDVCVRFGWQRVAGVDKPVRLCSEWINFSDPSGETHTFQRETTVVQGADGRLYFDHGPRVDYRLLLLGVFVLLVIGVGIWLNRYLIARYRFQLKAGGTSISSTIH